MSASGAGWGGAAGSARHRSLRPPPGRLAEGDGGNAESGTPRRWGGLAPIFHPRQSRRRGSWHEARDAHRTPPPARREHFCLREGRFARMSGEGAAERPGGAAQHAGSPAQAAASSAKGTQAGRLDRRRPSGAAVFALIIGLLVTAGLAVASLELYRHNERRLLNLRVRELGLVIGGAGSTVQTPPAIAGAPVGADQRRPRRLQAVLRPHHGP